MPRSMTGYGAAEGPLAGGHLAIEIRTVNHRHFSAQLRLPAALLPQEQDIRSQLRGQIERGHVTLTARWSEEPPAAAAVKVNLPRARAIVEALTRLKDGLGLGGDIDVHLIARQPDVLLPAESDAAPVAPGELFELLDRAVRALGLMREREGEALGGELVRLLSVLERSADRVAARAPQRLDAERERLRRSVADLLDGRRLDEDRLAQEVALLADKLDITEELVRLRTHVSACRAALQEDAAVGRRLAFLGQEMLREVNTIGSKANDAEIAQAVVGMKGTLEKFREQVDNLE